MSAILELDNVSRRWIGRSAEVDAVKSASMRVDAGEFHVVRGASGAGKSTLILLASGLLRPDSGSVRVLGNAASSPGHTVGVVFQSMHLLPYLTAKENVLAAATGGHGVEETLERLGLSERAAHLPSELSVGERQRVALARAVVNEPPLLLADEPTGNLDPESSRVVFGVLDEWRRSGDRAVVVATHDEKIQVEETIDHVIEAGVLRRGLIRGPVAALVASIAVIVLLALALRLLSFPLTTISGEPLRLSCAAGIAPAVAPAATAFTDRTGIPVEIQYGGSGTLLAQFKIDPTTVDLYLAADREYVELAQESGLVRETLPLAQMRPVIAVAKGNPKGISSIADLADPAVRVGLANPDAAAIGRLARTILTKDGSWNAVQANTAVFKPTVNELANDLAIGAIDAAVIWDATAHQYDAIDLLRVDLFEAAPRTIAIGVADATPQSQEALKFARFLASPEHGGAAFTRWGYEPLDGDLFVDRPSILLFAGTMFNSAIEETVQAFEAREGVEVKRVYNGCGMLVAQMQSGATPDAYLACDQSFLDAIQPRFHGGYLVSQNPMVLAVAKGNPKAIKTLDDLAREGVRVGLAHPEKSALGSLSLALLEDEGLRARIDAAETQVQDSPQGDFLINALRTGAIDSAIVYLSNASMSRDEIDIIAIDSPLAHSTQPYAIARSTDAHQVMKRLLEAITTNESRARFEALGFDWGAQQ